MSASASHPDDSTARLERPRSLGSQLVEQLRRAIVRGDLAPGTHLVEDALAAEFDVSRGPVRDALRLLSTERLVEPRRRGVVVVGLTRDDLDELYSLRTSLETLAVTTVMRARPRVDLTALTAFVTQMRVAAGARDPDRFARADLDFHAGIYTAAGHRRLSVAWDHLRPTFAAMLEVTNTQDRDLVPVAEDHARLLELMRGEDESAALADLHDHLEQSHARMGRALAKRIDRTLRAAPTGSR